MPPGNVAVGTIHLAKRLEFRAVVVAACDDEVLPQARIECVGDPAELDEVYTTEPHLLYVECTRARDHLLVTDVEPASEFLDMREQEPFGRRYAAIGAEKFGLHMPRQLLFAAIGLCTQARYDPLHPPGHHRGTAGDHQTGGAPAPGISVIRVKLPEGPRPTIPWHQDTHYIQRAEFSPAAARAGAGVRGPRRLSDRFGDVRLYDQFPAELAERCTNPAGGSAVTRVEHATHHLYVNAEATGKGTA